MHSQATLKAEYETELEALKDQNAADAEALRARVAELESGGSSAAADAACGSAQAEEERDAALTELADIKQARVDETAHVKLPSLLFCLP